MTGVRSFPRYARLSANAQRADVDAWGLDARAEGGGA